MSGHISNDKIIVVETRRRWSDEERQRAGGNRAAAIYSLIETAKLNAIDPEAYLRDIIGRIADHKINCIAERLPWNW